jgi:integrase
MSEHKQTVQDLKNRTETGQTIQSGHLTKSQKKTTRLPKTHQGYWMSRLRKRSYHARNSQTEVEIPCWQVRLFHNAQEIWYNTQTANQATAAVKARDAYVFLRANGWSAWFAKFKPRPENQRRRTTTVGDYLDAVRMTGRLRQRTFLNYQNCLRTIVSGAFGVQADRARFDYRSGGNQKWRERVDRILLARVTPARVSAWQRAFVARADGAPRAAAAAKRTANTYVRCARSLFTRRLLKELTSVELPSPLPFDGVELFDAGSMKYLSKVNVATLIAAAREELKAREPEVYKAFLLGLFAGMRKGEIDLAEWSMVDFDKHVVRLEETEWLHLKTNDSAGEITVDPEVLAELKQLMPRGQPRFILESEHPARNDSPRPYYRCEKTFDRLTSWLRAQGVTANKPLHELRKEIGALVATQHGIYAASRFLRHSDITTTARHYADHKARISVGLGRLLDTGNGPCAEGGRSA